MHWRKTFEVQKPLELVAWYNVQRHYNEPSRQLGGWSQVHYLHPKKPYRTLCGKAIPEANVEHGDQGVPLSCDVCRDLAKVLK